MIEYFFLLLQVLFDICIFFMYSMLNAISVEIELCNIYIDTAIIAINSLNYCISYFLEVFHFFLQVAICGGSRHILGNREDWWFKALAKSTDSHACVLESHKSLLFKTWKKYFWESKRYYLFLFFCFFFIVVILSRWLSIIDTVRKNC